MLIGGGQMVISHRRKEKAAKVPQMTDLYFITPKKYKQCCWLEHERKPCMTKCMWAVMYYRHDVHRHLLMFSIKENINHIVVINAAPNTKWIIVYGPIAWGLCLLCIRRYRLCVYNILGSKSLSALTSGLFLLKLEALLHWSSLLINAGQLLSLLTLGKG